MGEQLLTEYRLCIYCGGEITWLPQHGGWNSLVPSPLNLDDCWCPEADPLLILGRATKTGYMKHTPARAAREVEV